MPTKSCRQYTLYPFAPLAARESAYLGVQVELECMWS
jgi:hypothetical protein